MQQRLFCWSSDVLNGNSSLLLLFIIIACASGETRSKGGAEDTSKNIRLLTGHLMSDEIGDSALIILG